MKLKTNGIDHLNLRVRNLEESVKFYGELLGFTVLKEQPEENSKIIGNERVKLCLYETPGFRRPDKSNLGHFCLQIENFGDIMTTCREMGIAVEYGGKTFVWEYSRSVYILDPNGYEIEFSEVWGGGLD
jgi:catechol 2,3-dioxygenase-like lactoylglutathione lyase family enzyme